MVGRLRCALRRPPPHVVRVLRAWLRTRPCRRSRRATAGGRATCSPVPMRDRSHRRIPRGIAGGTDDGTRSDLASTASTTSDVPVPECAPHRKQDPHELPMRECGHDRTAGRPCADRDAGDGSRVSTIAHRAARSRSRSAARSSTIRRVRSHLITHAVEVRDEQATIRVVFVCDPMHEFEVRSRIDASLAAGAFRGPDGVTSTWRMLEAHAGHLDPAEHALADRLLES